MGHKVKQSLMSSRIDFFYYTFRNVLLVSIPLLVISTFILGFSVSHSSATGSTSGSDNLAITISSSCTLSSVVNIPHNAEVYNGNYLGNIGKTTIKTLCNDGNGYSVYAVGYSNNEEGNNKLINSEYPQYSIDTGLATSGLTSQWAMKLNNIPDDPSPTPPTIESDYNNTYGIVPPYWTKVAGRASGTTDMAEGSSFTTTYAVYASSSQYAGTYQGQVKYLLTHPNSNAQHFFMQNVAEWKEQMLPHEGDSIQAIDQRDGKKYWVTRLADGHISMTQNLDFDIDSTRTYTHNDTDLGWDSNNFDANATWTPDTTNGKYNLPINGTSVPNWSNQNNYPYSADPGDVYYYTSNSASDDIKYTSLSTCTTAGHTADECKHYHAGNYYNWTAAIASNNSSSLTTQYSNAPNSICPAGWRLPIATNANQSVYEFGELLYQQGIIATKTSTSYAENGFNNVRKAPLWLSRSGNIGAGTLNDAATHGYYWSNTISNSEITYYLDFTNSNVWSAYNIYYRRGGRSVRCLAR